MASVGPPAANGATIVMGRVGYVCALAICETAGSAAAPAARRRKLRLKEKDNE
jgi:F0F1-type ATP synthase membrane subunit c/vacuolar-type H+-ATPase subunit K